MAEQRQYTIHLIGGGAVESRANPGSRCGQAAIIESKETVEVCVRLGRPDKLSATVGPRTPKRHGRVASGSKRRMRGGYSDVAARMTCTVSVPSWFTRSRPARTS